MEAQAGFRTHKESARATFVEAY